MPFGFLKSLARSFRASRRPEVILANLKRSVVFSPDYPLRKPISHREYAESSYERETYWDIAVQAARKARPNVLGLRFMASDLGKAHYLPAAPTLIELWQHCPLVPLREGVGWALWELGTQECLDAMIRTIEEYDCEYMAIAAIFTQDDTHAFDKLAKYFDAELMSLPGGAVIPNRVLQNFTPEEKPDRQVTWSEAVVGDLLLRDRRWFELVKRARQFPATADAANGVLKYVDQS